MSYTAPPNYGSGPSHFSEPEVSIIGDTWNLVKDRLGEYALMGLVIFAVTMIVQFAYAIFTAGFSGEWWAGPALGTAGFFIDWGVQLIGYGFVGVVEGGIAYYAIKHARGQNPTLSDFSAGMRNVGSLFVVGVVVNIMVTIAAIFCCLPLFIVGGLTMLTIPLIVDRNMAPLDAIAESWRVLSAHWLKATLFFFVAGLVAALGVLACGIGIIVTIAIMYASYSVLYVRMFDQPQYSSASPYPRGAGPGAGIGQPPPPQNPAPPTGPTNF
jgi:hypothetical protein